MPACRLGLLLPLLLVACGDAAPPAPIVKLAAGPDTVSTGYAEVIDAEWLGDRRWAVVAPLDVTVGLVDLGARRIAPLGGKATKEIRNPATAFLAGDTLYVGDWGLRRISLWGPDGRLHSRASGAVQDSRRAAGGERRHGPLVRRAEAPAGAGRQRQPGFGGRGGGDFRLRAAGHPRPARPARPRGSGGRRGAAVRAAGAQRHRPLGRAARRLGLGRAGVRRTG